MPVHQQLQRLAHDLARQNGGGVEHAPPAELRRTVEALVADGHRVVGVARAAAPDGSATVVVALVERVGSGSPPPPDAAKVAARFGLTRRETEVALHLANRHSSAEIARALGVTVHTARRHAERVLTKLGVRSRREVARVLGGEVSP